MQPYKVWNEWYVLPVDSTDSVTQGGLRVIVTYKTHTAVVMVRPQTAVPALGQHVLVVPEAGDGCRYRVVAVEWPLHVPARDYFSMTDEADVQVHVLLEPCRDDQEEDLCAMMLTDTLTETCRRH